MSDNDRQGSDNSRDTVIVQSASRGSTAALAAFVRDNDHLSISIDSGVGAEQAAGGDGAPDNGSQSRVAASDTSTAAVELDTRRTDVDGPEPAAWRGVCPDCGWTAASGHQRAYRIGGVECPDCGARLLVENLEPLFTGEQMARREADVVAFIIGRLRDDGINISEGGEEKLVREVDEKFRTYTRLPEPGEAAELDRGDEADYSCPICAEEMDFHDAGQYNCLNCEISVGYYPDADSDWELHDFLGELGDMKWSPEDWRKAENAVQRGEDELPTPATDESDSGEVER